MSYSAGVSDCIDIGLSYREGGITVQVAIQLDLAALRTADVISPGFPDDADIQAAIYAAMTAAVKTRVHALIEQEVQALPLSLVQASSETLRKQVIR
jgi:hypothetical protein